MQEMIMPGITSEGSVTSFVPTCVYAEEADLCAQMFWIGGDGAQRLRRCPEQDAVNHCLVLERDSLDLPRHGEHDVEIRHVKQLRLPVRNPLGACQALALRTVSVTTGVVRDALMAAFAATLNVTAECCRAAALDSDHGTAARSRQRRAVLITESRTEVAEYIRHFQPLAGHGPAVRWARDPARPVSSHLTSLAD